MLKKEVVVEVLVLKKQGLSVREIPEVRDSSEDG